MARIRTVKPGFFKNEDLAELPMACRMFFIGLWTQADKEGRLEDRPKRLKAEIFPYDSVNIEELLSRLQSAGFIQRYGFGEMKLIQVVGFTKHQRITGSEAESKSEFPAPQLEGNILENFGNTLETPETTGRERKGREEEGKGMDTEIQFCEKVFSFKDYPKQMLEKFILYWTEKNEGPNSKMRFEKEKTWDLEKRLARWKLNDEKFKNEKNGGAKNFTAKPLSSTIRTTENTVFGSL